MQVCHPESVEFDFVHIFQSAVVEHHGSDPDWADGEPGTGTDLRQDSGCCRVSQSAFRYMYPTQLYNVNLASGINNAWP